MQFNCKLALTSFPLPLFLAQSMNSYIFVFTIIVSVEKKDDNHEPPGDFHQIWIESSYNVFCFVPYSVKLLRVLTFARTPLEAPEDIFMVFIFATELQ